MTRKSAIRLALAELVRLKNVKDGALIDPTGVWVDEDGNSLRYQQCDYNQSKDAAWAAARTALAEPSAPPSNEEALRQTYPTLARLADPSRTTVGYQGPDLVREAVQAYRALLQETPAPEKQEPVAWLVRGPNRHTMLSHLPAPPSPKAGWSWTPLYAGAPQADARDAARYRWLRDDETGDADTVISSRAEHWDAAIDAALAQEGDR